MMACEMLISPKDGQMNKIDEVLQMEIPDNEYFNSRGIYNYHGGANVLFEDETILEWIIAHKKAMKEEVRMKP